MSAVRVGCPFGEMQKGEWAVTVAVPACLLTAWRMTGSVLVITRFCGLIEVGLPTLTATAVRILSILINV